MGYFDAKGFLKRSTRAPSKILIKDPERDPFLKGSIRCMTENNWGLGLRVKGFTWGSETLQYQVFGLLPSGLYKGSYKGSIGFTGSFKGIHKGSLKGSCKRSIQFWV